MLGLDIIGRHPEVMAAAWSRIARLPERRLAMLMDLYRGVSQRGSSGKILSGLIKNFQDNPNSLEWLLQLVERLNEPALRAFVLNLLLGEMIEGQRLRKEFLAREGFEPPVTIVINPTMACNLRCDGCYSFKMPRRTMEYPLLRRILQECREMGTRFITVSGGEPLLYRHLFEMLQDFPDLVFMSYTNGTLIDEKMADGIAAAGNLWPALSVEGFGDETDHRRGEGVHDQVLRAMRLLRERGVMFGFSATPTRHNADLITSDDFIDYYMDKGVMFGWMFQYVPVGRDPDLTLMSTPAQREKLRAKVKEWYVTKPLFVGDFWNDGACVGGCLSATRYCYITPEGKVQPCTFVHFYTHDINHCTLRDVFRSPFFRAIRARQPYKTNLLRPCKIIDNPEVLRQVVRECGAMPSYPGAQTIVEDPTVRAFLDSYAGAWRKIADEVWSGPQYQNGRSVLVPFLGRINVYERFYSIYRSRAEKRQAELCGGAPPSAREAGPATRSVRENAKD